MTDEEKFIESLYEEADESLKEIYRQQKESRDDILKEIAMIMLTYNVLDQTMNINRTDKEKLYKKLSSLIIIAYETVGEKEIEVLNIVLESTVKKTFEFYSYNAGLKNVKKIIEDNFKGKVFSERVWENQDEVSKKLHSQIKKFLDGKINVNQIKKDIEKTFNNSAYNSKRLVETEVSRCSSNAFDKFCEETGVKKVKYNATLDSKICNDCAEYHNKIFSLKDKIEVPRHPLCRCFYTIEE
ncbi:NAD+--asparagine ADP-ribosyltransferase [uncultured Clostridium sp.]|uniref:minor capsid protein n=1 Tax=uncultured Clostridium sp. TaxID=59620 RepID=UPI000822D415|nr:minor capsid protein [uncultured Clostridium sp.]SCJ96082.1 NAD+--asparagine ADP-ribosyltransferase [uncultured Clostridium sp.]